MSEDKDMYRTHLDEAARLLAEKCREENEIAKYRAMPEREWDGKTLLHSGAYSRYFRNLDDIREFLDPPFKDGSDREPMKIDDLRLVICVPVTVRQLRPEMWTVDLEEEGDLPDDLWEAIDAFNTAVKDIVLAWQPGKYRAVIRQESDG